MNLAARLPVKFFLVVVACALLIFATEAIVFAWLGNGGGAIIGPVSPVSATDRFYFDAWFDRFGYRPEKGNTTVLAPIMPVVSPHDESIDDASQVPYRIRDAAPAQEIYGTDGMIVYHISRGPTVPRLLPIQLFDSPTQYFQHVVHAWRTARRHCFATSAIAVSVSITYEDELWCQSSIAMPFRFRTREFVGTTDDFMSALSSTKGWRTSRFDWNLFIHNVVLWTLLLGWLAFLPEYRALYRHCLHRRRIWIRQGRCGVCGCDLRELKTNRCPECGTEKPEDGRDHRAEKPSRPLVFGLTGRELIGIVLLNTIACLIYTGLVYWMVARSGDRELIGQFAAYFPRDTALAVVTSGMYLLAAGNLLPMLWLVFCFGHEPQRSRFAPLAAVSIVTTALAAIGAMTLLPGLVDALIRGQGITPAVSILSLTGFLIVQGMCIALVELGYRLMRRRSTRASE